MVNCCVISCKSRTERKFENRTFHTFPQHETLRRVWIAATGRQNWQPTQYHRICSIHFKADCFVKKQQKIYLAKYSIPTLDVHTAEDTELAVANDIMNDDWKTSGGSIWNHGQERTTKRVKTRATTCQLVQLVKFMEKHKELAVSHTHPFPESEDLWEQLATTINQFGPPKTSKQCKTTWRDLRKRAYAVMRAKNKDVHRNTGRNLYGMAPKIIRLIAAVGGLPRGGLPGFRSPECSSKTENPASPEVPLLDPLGDARDVIKVAKTPSGNQLVIRIPDKSDSKSNVFNRFSVSDGHFENNIVVKAEQGHQSDGCSHRLPCVCFVGFKEEREDPHPDNEESSENMETEGSRDQEFSRNEDMSPAAEAVLGNQENASEMCMTLKKLNETLRLFMTEYSDRTQLERERFELDRARLEFDMKVFNSKSSGNNTNDKS